MGKLKEFLKVGKEVREEDKEENKKEQIDRKLKDEIKMEVLEDTKESLKTFGIMGGVSILVLGLVIILIVLFVPKNLTKMLDKYLTNPTENTQTTDSTSNGDTTVDQTPNTTDDDITGSPAIGTDDKIDCTKLFDAVFITTSPVREEVSFMSDGSYNRLVNNNDAYIGSYTINNKVLSVSEISSDGENKMTYTISNNCNEITRNNGNNKIVLKRE